MALDTGLNIRYICGSGSGGRSRKSIEENLLFITINYGLRRDVSVEEQNNKKAITDLLLDWGDNQDSEKEQQEILNGKYFDYSKPTKLLLNILKSPI